MSRRGINTTYKADNAKEKNDPKIDKKHASASNYDQETQEKHPITVSPCVLSFEIRYSI